jgi:hypothetical protein
VVSPVDGEDRLKSARALSEFPLSIITTTSVATALADCTRSTSPLQSRPMLRTTIIVALCLCGLAFSLSGVVLAWRRLKASGGEIV